jgi:hypothetical protein
MRKRYFTICAVLAIALTATAPPAVASTTKPSMAQSTQISPDVFTGSGYVKNYNQYLTYPLYWTQGYVNGGEITFHYYGKNSPNVSSQWYAYQKGTVSRTWPFSNGGLDSAYYGHAVIQLRHYISTDWDLGASDNLGWTVLRPVTYGNYLVEYSLGGANYWIIDVHVSDAYGDAQCVQYTQSDYQASFVNCGAAGTTLSWQTLG